VRRAALIAAAAVALAGCGGGAGPEEARDLIDRGFATDVRSGVFSASAELRLSGLGALAGPLRLSLEGPFEGGSPATLPAMDLEVRVSGMGQRFAGRLVMTPENGWVEYDGTTYEAGEALWAELRRMIETQAGEPMTLAELGLHPHRWLDDLETEGDEEVAGDDTTKVTGTVDLGVLLREGNRLSPEAPLPPGTLRQVEAAFEEVRFEAWIGDDDIWRRVSVETEFEIPEGLRESAEGVAGGRLSFEMGLDDPNEPVEIEGLGDGRPVDELLRRLGIPPEALFGPGFAQPTPG
jgi:hypothetical protein